MRDFDNCERFSANSRHVPSSVSFHIEQFRICLKSEIASIGNPTIVTFSENLLFLLTSFEIRF